MRTRSISKSDNRRRSSNRLSAYTSVNMPEKRKANNDGRWVAKKPKHRLFIMPEARRPSIPTQPEEVTSSCDREEVQSPPIEIETPDDEASPPTLVQEVHMKRGSPRLGRGLALYAYANDVESSKNASVDRETPENSDEEDGAGPDPPECSEYEDDGIVDSSDYSEAEIGISDSPEDYEEDSDGEREALSAEHKAGGMQNMPHIPTDEFGFQQDTPELSEDDAITKDKTRLPSELVDASNILALLGSKFAGTALKSAPTVGQNLDEREDGKTANRRNKNSSDKPMMLTALASAASQIDRRKSRGRDVEVPCAPVDEPTTARNAVNDSAHQQTVQYIIPVDEYDKVAGQMTSKYIAVDPTQTVDSSSGIQLKPYYLLPLVPVAPPPSVCSCVCRCGAVNDSRPTAPLPVQQGNMRDPPLAQNLESALPPAAASKALLISEPLLPAVAPKTPPVIPPAMELLDRKLPAKKHFVAKTLPTKNPPVYNVARPMPHPRGLQNSGGYCGPYALPPPYPPQCLVCHSGYYPILNHPMYYAGSVLPPPPDYYFGVGMPPPPHPYQGGNQNAGNVVPSTKPHGFSHGRTLELPQGQSEESETDSDPDAVDKLIETIKKVGEKNGKPNGVPPVVLRQLVQAISKPTRTPVESKFKRWTKEEDDKLLKACEGIPIDREHNWCRISSDVFHGQRSAVQCKSRWHNMIRPGRKVGNWTKEEDAKIVQLKQDGKSFTEIAVQLPDRSLNHIRERWITTLDPSINNGPWTDEEMKILLETRDKIGNKWLEISKLLPGRSVPAVKNRYYNIQTSRLREGRRLAADSLRKWDWKRRKDEMVPAISKEENPPCLSSPTSTTPQASASEADSGKESGVSCGMVPMDEDIEELVSPSALQKMPTHDESDHTGTRASGMVPIL